MDAAGVQIEWPCMVRKPNEAQTSGGATRQDN